MSELAALPLSCLYVFAVIAAATLLRRRGLLGAAAARKVVHVGAAHWWLFLIAFLRSPPAMLAGPVGFLLVNLLSRRLRLFRVMEEGAAPESLGTIYFPLSLIVLVLLVVEDVMPAWVAGIGVLVMGWGDGLAALAGSLASRRKGSRAGKTGWGSAAMFAASFLVVAIMGGIFAAGGAATVLVQALAVALFASMVERATPWGLDNLTVPILTALFYRFAAEGGLAPAFAFAALLNIAAAVLAHRARALTDDGAVAAACVGSALLCAGGPRAYALLMLFFLSANAIGRASRSRVRPSGIEAKGDRRDALQVLANSGAALVALGLYACLGREACLVAFGAAIAAANADTWASELGILHRRPPRHLLSRRPLPAGSSGAVSPLGFAASALGALVVGLAFFLLYRSPPGRAGASLRPAAIVTVLGFAGALVDSLLGATVQAQYLSPTTGRMTERSAEAAGPTTLVRGLRWVSNDTVNAASTLAAALLAGLASALL